MFFRAPIVDLRKFGFGSGVLRDESERNQRSDRESFVRGRHEDFRRPWRLVGKAVGLTLDVHLRSVFSDHDPLLATVPGHG